LRTAGGSHCFFALGRALFWLMSHESDRRAPAPERSFGAAEDESELIEDVLSYIRASKENGSGRSAETLQVRLLWQILKALDGGGSALAEESDPD
jgi:hypothetical protein